MKRILSRILGASALGAACLLGASQVQAETCPLSLTPFGQLFPEQSEANATSFEDQEVQFVAFVGDASLDLVGTNVTSVTSGTTFAIDSAPECTGSSSGSGNIVGDSRFDDAIVRCGFFSVPESLIGAIGILGTVQGDDCVP